MNASAPILPGIYFDTVQPPLNRVLPRMDIGAFVGFSSSGPLHTPVAIEDMDRFREIFGMDIELAWDAERNQVECSFLAASVETFFRNGGKRCWVVRVADETLAQTAEFNIPGLFRTDGSVLEQAKCNARSAGAWAESVRLRSRLNIDSLILQAPLAGEVVLHIDETFWYADVVAHEGKIQTGDLISISLDAGESSYYLFVSQIQANEQGIRISGKEGYYYFSNPDHSPPVLDPGLAISSQNDEFQLFSLGNFASLGLNLEWPTISSPEENSLPALHLLSFNLRSLERRGQTKELANLTFRQSHTRFWGLLPGDEALFSAVDGQFKQTLDSQSLELVNAANTPRFPISAPIEAKDYVYLPLGMLNTVNVSGRAEFTNQLPTLLRNGIRNFGATHFLDARLSSLNLESLTGEANRLVYLSDQPTYLRGLHTFLTLKEATLISVPDAIHRRWDDIPPEFNLPLSAPELNRVEADELVNNTWRVHWSRVEDACYYTLEWSKDPDFSQFNRVLVQSNDLPQIGETVDLQPEPETEYYIELKTCCPQEYFFRVRAERETEISPWSNNRAIHIPQVDFTECSAVKASSLELQLNVFATGSPVSSPEEGDDQSDSQLVWTLFSPTTTYNSIDRYEVQRAKDFSFTVTETLFDGSSLELEDPDNPTLSIEAAVDSNFYFRVRAKDRTTTGPWSNIIILWPARLSRMSLQNKSDFMDTDLLAIHRAMLRTCAARSDLFAVLGLPRHYETQDALNHYAKLKPTNQLPSLPSSEADDLNANVQALTTSEKSGLSHAALYFPWVAARTDSGSGIRIDVRYLPPDGPVIGKIASKAIEQGPWIAPANSPLEGVLALNKNLGLAQWQQLSQSRINVICKQNRGYLLLSADTLSAENEFKEINVRRLMSLIRRIAEREGNRYVFENNNTLLHNKVKQQFETLFSRLFEQGAFAGKSTAQAYRVVTGPEVNPIQSIELGRHIIELHVAPSRALKFIRVRLIQEGNGQIMLQELAG